MPYQISKLGNPSPRNRWYFTLWFWVLIFMSGGIIFASISPGHAKQTEPIITLFIHIIKLMVCPIIFLTVVIGIVEMGSLKQLGTIGSKAFIYFEFFSTLALIIGLSFGHIFKPGHGLNLSIAKMNPNLVNKYVEHSHDTGSLKSILLSAVPHNPITPFITGNTLQVLLLAIGLGFILFYFKPSYKVKIINGLKLLQHYAFKLLSILMLFAPLAAFAAMAFMVADFGTNILWHLLALVITMIGACVFFIVIVLGSILKLNGLSIFKILKLIKDEIILVFATSSSESALGPLMQKLNASGVDDSVVGIVIPAGYSFNLDGTNIYLALSIAFLCHAFNIDLSLSEYITIIIVLMATSKGAAGVTGAGFIVLAGTLASMHGKIPVVTIGILLGIDKIMSELRSTTNLVGNSIAAIIIAKWEKKLDQVKLKEAIS